MFRIISRIPLHKGAFDGAFQRLPKALSNVGVTRAVPTITGLSAPFASRVTAQGWFTSSSLTGCVRLGHSVAATTPLFRRAGHLVTSRHFPYSSRPIQSSSSSLVVQSTQVGLTRSLTIFARAGIPARAQHMPARWGVAAIQRVTVRGYHGSPQEKKIAIGIVSVMAASAVVMVVSKLLGSLMFFGAVGGVAFLVYSKLQEPSSPSIRPGPGPGQQRVPHGGTPPHVQEIIRQVERQLANAGPAGRLASMMLPMVGGVLAMFGKALSSQMQRTARDVDRVQQVLQTSSTAKTLLGSSLRCDAPHSVTSQSYQVHGKTIQQSRIAFRAQGSHGEGFVNATITDGHLEELTLDTAGKRFPINVRDGSGAGADGSGSDLKFIDAEFKVRR